LALAELPEHIRGYGHVREAAARQVREQAEQLKARMLVSAIPAVNLFKPAA
jgi:indolepyruvate ferredoxin oxidoreductase